MYLEGVPAELIEKWQVTVDLMRQFFNVQAALVNRVSEGRIEILVSGRGEKVYFNRGDSGVAGTGHYCDEVVATGEMVHVQNAAKDPVWRGTEGRTKGMVSYLGCPVHWPDGSVFGTICVLDIVERSFDENFKALLDQFRSIIESDLYFFAGEIKQKKSVWESENKYRLLSENAEDVIWILDLESFRFKYVSPSIFKLRGYTVEEAMNQAVENAVNPEDFHFLSSQLKGKLDDYNSGQGKIEKRYRYEIQQPCKDGSMVWVEINASIITDEEGNPREVLGVSRDITERKIIENQVRDNERQLSVIFNNAPAMMILVNDKLEILKINHVGLHLVQREESEVINLRPGDVLSCINSVKGGGGCGTSKDCKNCMIRNTFSDTIESGRDHIKTEGTLTVNRNGAENILTVLISSSVVTAEPERKILITIDDITSRKRMETDLLKAKEKAEESDRLKTAFLANMSHEIRTPLNGILGFSHLISDAGLEAEKRAEFVDIINASGKQLLGIINNIIEISRVETGQLELNETNVPVNDLLDDIFTCYSSEAESQDIKLTLVKSIPGRDFMIRTDSALLRQILENLLDNALKFTDNGEVVFGYENSDGIVSFFVEDSGIGVREEERSAIFERFVKFDGPGGRKYPGNGLGLSLSKSYAGKLGGSLKYADTRDRGSKFILEIPVIDAAGGPGVKTDIETVDAGVNISNLNKTVLVVEDEEINYIYIAEVLSMLGASVLWAKTGREAIETARNNRDIILVIMDIKLPDMSGYEVTEAILSDMPEMPVVALTAYALSGDREKAVAAGCRDYISKPAKADTLMKILGKYIA